MQGCLTKGSTHRPRNASRSVGNHPDFLEAVWPDRSPHFHSFLARFTLSDESIDARPLSVLWSRYWTGKNAPMVARVLSISHVSRLEPLIRSPWGRCNCLLYSWRSINGSIEERGNPRDNPSVGLAVSGVHRCLADPNPLPVRERGNFSK